MPHLLLELSANVPDRPDLRRVLLDLHEALAKTGEFRLLDVKSRVVRHEVAALGDGAPDRAFAALTIAILEGRSDELKARVAAEALAVLKAAFPGTVAGGRGSLSVEVRDLHRASYQRVRAEEGPRTRSTRFEVDVDAPLEAVWKALTEAGELVRWFPMRAEVVPGPGGSVLWAWGEAWEWRHRIGAWEPYRRLTLVQDVPQRFDADGKTVEDRSTGEPMSLDVTLAEREGGTRVTLVHSGFGHGPAWDDEVEATSVGWRHELSALELYLEKHRGKDRRVGWATASTALPREEVWRRLLSSDGFDLEADRLQKGAPFRVAAADGGRLAGRFLEVFPGQEVSGELDGLGGGIFRLSTHRAGGRTGLFAWLSAYSPDVDVEGFASRARALLRRLFPPEPPDPRP